MLICEDSEKVASILEKLFEKRFDLLFALSVDEGLALLRERGRETDPGRRFAVAIVDLSFGEGRGMPNTEGFRVLEEVQKDPFMEPIVFTGTGEDVQKAIQSLERGAFRYVLKGPDKNRLSDGSIANLKRAVTEALACWKALVELDAMLDQLANAQVRDILKHARLIFECIQQIRGRGKQRQRR